jgi:CRISPR-associated protein Cas5h
MSCLLIFDLRGPLAHFRRPDTLGTHASYPFITRTALRGLVGAVLGLDELPAEVRTGIRLLAPVRSVAQELSLHGKTWVARSGNPDSFHRPTSIELIVQPHYRIYYMGPLAEELGARLRARQSHFHTYLGSAFCLTVPEWVKALEVDEPERTSRDRELTCVSVVPSPAVAQLHPREGRQYARVGGLLREHLGPFHARRFRGTLAVVYEVNGGSLTFSPHPAASDSFWHFFDLPEEGTVCLW